MSKLKVLDLFSGIGGFSLGLERTGGFETVAFCEIEECPRRVLAKHWPEVKQYGDVRELTADVLRADGIAVDVICGGFPCQDISVAGKRAGIQDDTRSGLWSEIDRLIGELRPKFVIVENVSNLLSGPSERPGGWFGRVLGDLAKRRYDAEWRRISAFEVGAPHRRERVWVVAYPNDGHEQQAETVRARRDATFISRKALAYADSLRELQQEGREQDKRGRTGNGGEDVANAGCFNEQGQQPSVFDAKGWQGSILRQARSRGDGLRWWASEPDVGRMAHGVPNGSHRLKALGNAVVPAIPQIIGHAILKARAAA